MLFFLVIRNREAICNSCDRMDREREALQKKVGTFTVAVDRIRESRDKCGTRSNVVWR